MKKLVLETTAPFQGLPELVAYDEGLFEQEGITVEWADREQGVEKKVETHVTSPKGVDPFASHGKLFEQGRADMYNACEWGNYCRVQETGAGSRQLGRRAIVTYSALVVAPDSPVFTPQQLANKTIGVPFYFGTHYIALHMLEGFLPRAERFALPARRADEGRDRCHHADRAAHHAGGEEGLPYHLLGFLPRHRGGIGPRGCGNLRRLQPCGA
jgi:NitT/TauT family transport system substrate-binding protein